MSPASGNLRRLRLRGRIGGEERLYILLPGENQVGSSDGNELILPVEGVSRRHALLCWSDGRLRVEDLGSRNGTFVNGGPTRRADVSPGDVLGFGPATFRVEEVDPGDAELALLLADPDPVPDLARPGDRTTAAVEPSGPDPAADDIHRGLVWPAGCVPGSSPAMVRLYEEMRPLVAALLPVLIEGETGVGKEFVARALHLSSRRAGGPFVATNCAAIPAELLEAEMFGIGDGVATGVKKRPGTFRSAHGGTLFLDEIGEMPPELQAKLLRALQEKEVQPVGGGTVPVDVWVIAATNLDLARRVEDGRFRRDLYYRVAGCVLEVPPLRERREDIPLLVGHFLRRAAAGNGRKILGVSARALEYLTGYSWPGNVRELEHEVLRLGNLCADGQAVESSLLSEKLSAASQPPAADSLRLAVHVREAERRAIFEALEQAGGSRRKAAKLLGIARSTLLRKLRDFDPPS